MKSGRLQVHWYEVPHALYADQAEGFEIRAFTGTLVPCPVKRRRFGQIKEP